ncbi:hypothetical protein [Pseudomonas sp. GL-B-16]|uniref:hypothetical protein n=1 Tax=Pseudomonas sp. GL-B-16 TaxID=2832373 RepID=UPI001CBEC384|nr:hypothetical protein [Pseudomonas sp. GL-B-16]
MKTSVPNESIKPVEYVPFEASRYPLSEAISAAQRAAIRTIRQRADWAHLSIHVPELFHPLRDIARLSSTSQVFIVRAIARLLKHVHDCQRPYWLWSEAQWVDHLTGSGLAARPYLTAVAYHLRPIRQPQRLPYARQPSVYAMTIFGEAFVKQELARLQAVLVALGYSAADQALTCRRCWAC